jgi:glutathione S-transferase
MKLYTFAVAPNPTKVNLYLAEKAARGAQIPLEVEEVSLIEGEHRKEPHLTRNPLGYLPVLEFDDGSFLTESLAIIEYLEERFPSPSMIGEGAQERARVRSLERTIDLGILIGLGRLLHATNSPVGYPPNPEVADYFRASSAQVLSHLNDLLADGRPFVAGDTPTIADCTLGGALQFARFGKVYPTADYPNIARWDKVYRARDAVKDVFFF